MLILISLPVSFVTTAKILEDDNFRHFSLTYQIWKVELKLIKMCTRFVKIA